MPMDVSKRSVGGPLLPGVLWVHGYTVDSTIWDELWSLLPEWSHYAIDLPGHGLAPPLKPGTTLDEIGHRLAEAAVEWGVQHVVGLSFGSIIALQAATSLPGAFETLTLAAPVLGGGPVDRDVGLRYLELSNLYKRRGAGPWMTELWMRCPPATFAHASDDLRARLATVIDRHTWCELIEPEKGFGALVRQTQDPRLLAVSTVRPLFIIGEHELPAFRQTTEILRHVRPDARFVVLPRAGHLCLLQNPAFSARLMAEHWEMIKRKSTQD
jgi:2-succinyl-6-hydroxy-2,4-cyclohexadiene-1-carboxylate synthase